MLTNSKVKYPSFRIDDILNSNFGTRTLHNIRPENNENDLRTYQNELEASGENALKTASEDELIADDQPINLSSECSKKSDNLFNLPFNFQTNLQKSLQTNESFTESQYKNLKSISSISSSSPTLSVGSSDSPSFQNQPSPTSKSPTIDQLIKCNDLNSSSNDLKNHFPTNLLSLSLCDETNHSYPNSSLSNASLPDGPFFIGQQYPRSAIEEFYLKLNKKQLENSEPNKFESATFDKPVDELSLHNISDALKKFQQDCKYSEFYFLT